MTQGKDQVCSHYLIQKANYAQLNALSQPLQEGIWDIVECTEDSRGNHVDHTGRKAHMKDFWFRGAEYGSYSVSCKGFSQDSSLSPGNLGIIQMGS